MTTLNTDEFGMRMKSYESVETHRRLDPQLPIYARIDGRRFSKFTQGMRRPYDPEMTQAMVEVTRYLVKETNARIGYTQSDEISLTWLAENPETEALFGGKVQKLVSVLAAMATAKFARVCPFGYSHRLPHFDCRVFQLPSRDEAANAFLWRAMDARKNAIQMTAQHFLSHKALYGKGQSETMAMLAARDVHFESYPEAFKRGTFVRRHVVRRHLTENERARIPEHHKHKDSVINAMVDRTEIVSVLMPPFH